MTRLTFRDAAAGKAGGERKRDAPLGRVSVTRSIAMPNGSRINVVRKDVMDHALGRDRPGKN